MYFVRFHPEVTSCLLSRGKTKYATLGMRLWCKYIRNYLLVYQLTSHFLPYLWNYKEFEDEISDLQSEKYGLSFETKKYTTSGWARGDENVIGIRVIPNHNENYSNISVMPKLVGNETSYAPLVNLVQEISLFLVFNMALAAILKNRLLEYFPATFGRCIGGLFFVQMRSFCQINQETTVGKT